MSKPRNRPWSSFRDDDGSMQWGSVARHFKSRYHVAVMRLDNRWQDLRARLAGACNADLWTGQGLTGYAGGYSHWRCGRERGHQSPHRFHNYTWTGAPGDRPVYDPLPIRNEANTGWFDTRKVIPFMKLTGGRRAVDTRARSRRRAELQDAFMARRAAERTGS